MENILSELHCQTKYRGCLNELMSQLKQIQSQQHRTQQVHLDESIVEDIKEHLKNEQNGIAHLISLIKQDRKILDEANSNTSLIHKSELMNGTQQNNQM
jgi:nuclear pore complex protein Nup54